MPPYVRDPKLWASQRPSWEEPLDTTDDNDPSLPPRPLPNSYWATPTLLASEYPGGPTETLAIPRLTALLDVGITDFFDLTEKGELVPYSPILEKLVSGRGGTITKLDATSDGYSNFFQDQTEGGRGTLSVRYARFPIRDRSIPSTTDLRAILDALTIVHRQQGRKAVVHCWGGIGRTGTIVGCWLVHSGVVRDEDDTIVALGQSSSATEPGAVVIGEGPASAVVLPRIKPAGEVALEFLKKKWKGVDKSWRAPRTPENALQADVVRLYRPQSNLPL